MDSLQVSEYWAVAIDSVDNKLEDMSTVPFELYAPLLEILADRDEGDILYVALLNCSWFDSPPPDDAIFIGVHICGVDEMEEMAVPGVSVSRISPGDMLECLSKCEPTEENDLVLDGMRLVTDCPLLRKVGTGKGARIDFDIEVPADLDGSI